MSINIVTDSTSYLPAGYAERHGIDGVLYREFVDNASDEFYGRQSSGVKAVTSQPGPDTLGVVIVDKTDWMNKERS